MDKLSFDTCYTNLFSGPKILAWNPPVIVLVKFYVLLSAAYRTGYMNHVSMINKSMMPYLIIASPW